jgi:glucosamine-phosphate N-acetyltransferase
MSDTLFDPALISAACTSELPSGYTLRPLRRLDYEAGFLDVLRELTTVGEITKSAFQERYEWLRTNGAGQYFVIVICDSTGKIVGTGCIVAERKL